MPYTSIPTIADGDVLTASYLNGLSANQEYLHSLGNAANTPFNSIRDTQETFDADVQRWSLRHRLPYLHWRIRAFGDDWEYARIYFDGVKVGAAESPTSSTTGSVDLTDISAYPNYLGAWATSTSYAESAHGDGIDGNEDDGDLVSNGGAYYRCKADHTSSATDEPGTGVNWTDYWDLIEPPAVGTIYNLWVDVNFDDPTDVSIDYLIETDSASL